MARGTHKELCTVSCGHLHTSEPQLELTWIRRLRRGRILFTCAAVSFGSLRCTDSLVPDLQEAKDIGDEFLALEKFVNLNYLVRIPTLYGNPPKRIACCSHVDKASTSSASFARSMIF